MRRLVKALGVTLGITLSLVMASPAKAAGAPVFGSPANVGGHVHIEVSNHPVDGHPIPRGLWTFGVKITEHGSPGVATYVRLDDESTVKVKVPIPFIGTLGPCADCSVSFPLTVDFSSWSVGRHELHWHVDIPKAADGRQFTTARTQVCIVDCSPNHGKRSTPWTGGGSWYTGHAYAIALLTSPQTDVRPGGTVTVKSQYSGTPQVCAFINPDFHHDSHGLSLGCWASGSHSVTIPADTPLGAKFVIYASDGQEAGLFRMYVGDGSDLAITTYEFQSWWLKAGLVLP